MGFAMLPIRPVVISGPSGCGKSSLLKKLFSDYPDIFAFSVSHTTRGPRPGEVEGKAELTEANTDDHLITLFHRDRLEARGSETADSLQRRLATAKDALDYADEHGAYDKVIVNDDFTAAYDKLKLFLQDDIRNLLSQAYTQKS